MSARGQPYRDPARDEQEVREAPDMIAEVLDQGDEADAAGKAAYFGADPVGRPDSDRFVGVRVPVLRAIARRRHPMATFADLEMLLDSEWHEVRLLGGILAVERFKRADDDRARGLVNLVLDHLDRLDNWDLVDSVAPYLLGEWLRDNPAERTVLAALMDSPDPWIRRFALVATLGLIRADVLAPTMPLAERAITDEDAYVHKAAGWMLREVGVRDRALLDGFLDEHAAAMPRVMLRIAVEKHGTDERSRHLARRRERRTTPRS